jgi:hypothetical protein
MNEEFDILTAKVLAGEASPEEQARLVQLLEQNAELKRDFADLKATWDSIREIGPLAQAMEAPPGFVPSARLSRLQAAVKTKFGSAPEEDSIAQSNGLAREAHTTAGRIEPVREDTGRFNDEAGSAFSLVKQWFRGTIGVSPVSAAVGLLILAVLAGGILITNRQTTAPTLASETQVVAYLLTEEIGQAVWRAGKPIDSGAGAPLRASDEVRLAAGAKLRMITPKGLQEISGPIASRAGELVGNQANKIQLSNDRGVLSKEADAMRAALFQPAKQILAFALLVTTRSGQSIPLYSPLGSTANLTPLILWKSEPGKTYEIAITDEFDPKQKPLRLSGVVSPVAFTTIEGLNGRSLAKDGLYRITLSETGKPLSASEYTFRTVEAADGPRPSAPSDRLLRAFQILKAEPSRVGDALAEMLDLPAEFAETELALRLKLFAFGRLGYQEDFDAVAAKLGTLQAPP